MFRQSKLNGPRIKVGPCNESYTWVPKSERFVNSKCKTRENSNFLKNGKMVISVKIQNFSRSRMMKRTSPLESSREI